MSWFGDYFGRQGGDSSGGGGGSTVTPPVPVPSPLPEDETVDELAEALLRLPEYLKSRAG